MTYSMPRLMDKHREKLVDDLRDAIRMIQMISQRMNDLGFDEAAESLQTTIRDLRWQSEEMIRENV